MVSNRKWAHGRQAFQTYRATCQGQKTKKNDDAKQIKQEMESHFNQQNKKTAKVNTTREN